MNSPLASCDAKAAFPTHNLARAALRRILDRKPKGAARFTIYRCRHCGKWHIGSEHE